MRELADLDGRDLLETIDAEHLDLVQPSDRDIGKGTVGIVGEVDVIRDRAGIDRLQRRERRASVEHLCSAGVLEREPHLLSVRRRRDIGTERALLLHASDDLVVGDRDDDRFRSEGRADIAVHSVRRKNLHAGSGRNRDPRLLHERVRVQDSDVVLAAHRDPHFIAVGREKRFVRRPAHVGHVLRGICGGVDEGDRVRSDRDDRDGPVIGGISNAVHEHLAAIERAHVARLRLS